MNVKEIRKEVERLRKNNGRISIDMEVLNKYTTKQNFEELLILLHEYHKSWNSEEREEFPPVVLAIETFLQACGVEGYEFS